MDNTAFDVDGPADAPPIVFVHGAQVTRKVWLPQTQTLSNEYRTIALDMPGHGALAGRQFHLTDAVDEIASIIDSQANGRALIVALSLGGYVAMEFAYRYPQKAAGLILAGATLDMRSAWRWPVLMLAHFLLRFYNAPPVRWIDETFFRMVYSAPLEKLVLDAGLYRKPVAEAILEIDRCDFRREISAYPGPILYVNGQYDMLIRTGEEAFVAASKRAKLVIIKRAFHISNLDQAEAFTDAVRGFARSIGW